MEIIAQFPNGISLPVSVEISQVENAIETLMEMGAVSVSLNSQEIKMECNFCGLETENLVPVYGSSVCPECVELAVDTYSPEMAEQALRGSMSRLEPCG